MTRRVQYKLTPPVVPEHDEQKSIARTLTLELGPAGKINRQGVLWYSIDHANYAGEIPGVRIGRGIVSGVPDMFVLFLGRAYYVEIKTPQGILQPEQKSLITAILCAGGKVGMARNATDVLGLLDTWQIPRHNRVKVMA